MKPSDWLILQKKVRFGDCDSAGVIHFHNLLKWSHEAWEESIEIYGIPYQDIFPDFSKRKSQIIYPIVNCEANFLAPIKIGDFLKVKISQLTFTIQYQYTNKKPMRICFINLHLYL